MNTGNNFESYFLCFGIKSDAKRHIWSLQRKNKILFSFARTTKILIIFGRIWNLKSNEFIILGGLIVWCLFFLYLSSKVLMLDWNDNQKFEESYAVEFKTYKSIDHHNWEIKKNWNLKNEAEKYITNNKFVRSTHFTNEIVSRQNMIW